MQNEMTDPIFPALEVMRLWQDAAFEASNGTKQHDAALAVLGQAERLVLMTRPTTRAGALELLRYCSVEIQCDVFDRELVAEAIDHCATVLENGL